MRIGFLERWRRKRDEKRADAAISREIERIAVKSKAGFRTIGGYSKKLTGPAKNALKYIQDNIARIPDAVVLDPERWDSDNTVNTLFVDRKAMRDFLLSSKRLQTYFEGCGEARAMALMTADWRQKTIMGIEKEGEVIRRDVPQQAYYFEEHRIVEVEATLEKVREQLSIRILSALIVKVVMEIQGLQEWNQDLEREQDMLELFIHHSHGAEPASGRDAKGRRLAEAKELLSSIEQKERDLRDQIGDAQAQLKKVADVLLNPQPFFSVQSVTLHLNRLGIEVNRHSSGSDYDIVLAKCELVDQHPKAILWVQVDRQSAGVNHTRKRLIV